MKYVTLNVSGKEKMKGKESKRERGRREVN